MTTGRQVLLISGAMLACAWLHGVASGEDAPHPVDGRSPRSSDLTAALPPEQWTAVERSIDRGLKWLSSQQAGDGSFPGMESGQPAITCFAVMAFLSRGHVPEQGPYGKQLTRAVDYILSTQQPDGSFSALPWGPPHVVLAPSHTVSYNHPIAGLTLGEVYGMTTERQEAKIRNAVTKAIAFSRGQQTNEKISKLDLGGWRYPFPNSDTPTVRSDLSVTSWEFMFYRSARNAQFDIPREHVEEGIAYVFRCYEPNERARQEGVFKYRMHASPAKPTTNPMTGAGMLCLQLGGHHDHPYVRSGAEWLRDHPIPSLDQTDWFYYGNYYCSQAMAQMGGEYWDSYYPRLVAVLMPLQIGKGDWQNNNWEQSYGQCYSTSLAILALTPPYQLLPIYQR